MNASSSNGAVSVAKRALRAIAISLFCVVGGGLYGDMAKLGYDLGGKGSSVSWSFILAGMIIFALIGWSARALEKREGVSQLITWTIAFVFVLFPGLFFSIFVRGFFASKFGIFLP